MIRYAVCEGAMFHVEQSRPFAALCSTWNMP